MRLITGIQPSGTITIGNYIGAIKNLEKQVENNEVFVFIADQHAITQHQDPKEFTQNIKSLISLYMAMGIHERANIFCQSHLSSHAELGWILQCQTKMGELSRMTQFKDKAQKGESSGVGLFTYPTLMAADILLYEADAVPVGQDQKQHLELTRDLAQRFNTTYNKEVFKVPEPYISEKASKIYSLTDPSKKMSKSDENEKSYISILDDPKKIMKKIKSATTDSLGEINYDEQNQPGVSNLLVIYSSLEEITMDETLQFFAGQNYGFLKTEVANCIIKHLEPIQEKYKQFINDEKQIKEVLHKGKIAAQEIGEQTLAKVKETIGFYS